MWWFSIVVEFAFEEKSRENLFSANNNLSLLSDIQFAKLKIESSAKERPPRPPPPKLYSSERRPRTSAMSTAEGKSSPKLMTRRSAPHLAVEPLVGELISLDEKTNASSETGAVQSSTSSKVSAGTPTT